MDALVAAATPASFTRRLFDMVGFQSRVPIYATVDEALSAPGPGECHSMSLASSVCTVSMSPAWNDSYTRCASALRVPCSTGLMLRSYPGSLVAIRRRGCSEPTPNAASAPRTPPHVAGDR